MNDIIHCILYSILYKIVDDFYDEDIYKEYFPNVNLFFYFLIAIYTIYLFYFKNANDDMFLILFGFEIFYILLLFCNYFGYNDIVKLGEISLNINDPFTMITLIQLPMFIICFKKMIMNNLLLFVKLSFVAVLFGIIQDVDNSLLGKYVFNNKYNNTPYKKKYKFIYRIGLTFLCCLIYKFINNTLKCGTLFMISYFTSSVVSLYIQIMLEEHKEHKNFIENIMNIKNKLLQ